MDCPNTTRLVCWEYRVERSMTAPSLSSTNDILVYVGTCACIVGPSPSMRSVPRPSHLAGSIAYRCSSAGSKYVDSRLNDLELTGISGIGCCCRCMEYLLWGKLPRPPLWVIPLKIGGQSAESATTRRWTRHYAAVATSVCSQKIRFWFSQRWKAWPCILKPADVRCCLRSLPQLCTVFDLGINIIVIAYTE